MLWKESYCIGVDSIDASHRELFDVIEGLLLTFLGDNPASHREQHETAVEYIVSFVLNRLPEEEEYMRSISCTDYDGHVKEHDELRAVISTEAEGLRKIDFDANAVNAFTKTVATKLVPHITVKDHKITKGGSREESYLDCFAKSFSKVFETMFGVTHLITRQVDKHDAPENTSELYARIPIIGDVSAEAVFSFSKRTSLYLFNTMTYMDQQELDDMVCSAMAEVSNIVSGNAMTEFISIDLTCDICPPIVSLDSFETAYSNSSRVLLVETSEGNFGVEIFS